MRSILSLYCMGSLGLCQMTADEGTDDILTLPPQDEWLTELLSGAQSSFAHKAGVRKGGGTTSSCHASPSKQYSSRPASVYAGRQV